MSFFKSPSNTGIHGKVRCIAMALLFLLLSCNMAFAVQEHFREVHSFTGWHELMLNASQPLSLTVFYDPQDPRSQVQLTMLEPLIHKYQDRVLFLKVNIHQHPHFVNRSQERVLSEMASKHPFPVTIAVLVRGDEHAVRGGYWGSLGTGPRRMSGYDYFSARSMSALLDSALKALGE